MNKHHKRIILGATSSGLGAFFSQSKDSFLIEQTSMIGQDFASTFWPGTNNGIGQKEELDPIHKEAIERNLLENGNLHLPGFHSLLYKHLKPFSKQCLLLTEIVSVKKEGQKFTVEIYNKNGFDTLTCDELIDATSLMITNQNKREITKTSLGSVFITNQKDTPLPVLSDATIYPSRFSNEMNLHIPVEYSSDWAKLRWSVVEYIRLHKAELDGWILASIANYLYVKVNSNYSGVALALNPSQYSNVLEAYYAGKKLQIAGASLV